MKKIIPVYKPIGTTPFEVIKKLREKYPEFIDKKISYAGRLDPLAHGVLLLVIGTETKQKDKYLSLPKIYEFEVLFGLETDSYDILGYLKEIKAKEITENVNIFVNIFVNKHIGKFLQSYPPYSSRTVEGKPLFWWAKNGRIGEITIPSHKIEIFQFKIIKETTIPSQKLEQKIKNEIALVNGDFRQEMILARWLEFFSHNRKQKFFTLKFYVECSSGTYIREIAQEMGKEMGCGAIVIDIMRIKVGKYSLHDAINV